LFASSEAASLNAVAAFSAKLLLFAESPCVAASTPMPIENCLTEEIGAIPLILFPAFQSYIGTKFNFAIRCIKESLLPVLLPALLPARVEWLLSCQT
jgi:hypothetical protein